MWVLTMTCPDIVAAVQTVGSQNRDDMPGDNAQSKVGCIEILQLYCSTLLPAKISCTAFNFVGSIDILFCVVGF